MDKLKNKLLNVPYIHAIFTLPHQLNGLARANKDVIYSMIMKASWQTVKGVVQKDTGAIPGMTTVLHTFGSEMKYHIHTHSLVTFGGIDKDSKWKYPSNKQTIISYRKMCAAYKQTFLSLLRDAFAKGNITYYEDYETISKTVDEICWVVHTTRPTMNTTLIENYLARYINRIAVSNNRLKLLEDSQQVAIHYNDYKHQEVGKAAPKEVKYLEPLVAIDQILQHVLPRHFQKSRSYGLHNSSSKQKKDIDLSLKKNDQTIRTIFEILSHLLGLQKLTCQKCNNDTFEKDEIGPRRNYILTFINLKNKSPSPSTENINLSRPAAMSSTA